MNYIFFDIETEPLPEDELLDIMPKFNPDEVKLGNVKDKEKIDAKIAEAEAKHKEKFLADAALDPLTGRVLAIGWKSVGVNEVFIIGQGMDEAKILKAFWEGCLFDPFNSGPDTLVGFNSHSFDLPFLYKRSWKHGIRPPAVYRKGRYWNHSIDLREEWCMGDRYATGSLDSICKHFGLPGKNGSGKEFAKLWHGDDIDRQKAVDYLKDDVRKTQLIAEPNGGDFVKIIIGILAFVSYATFCGFFGGMFIAIISESIGFPLPFTKCLAIGICTTGYLFIVLYTQKDLADTLRKLNIE